MLTAVRLGGYVGILGVVFGAAWGGGALLGPEFTTAPAAVEQHMGSDVPLPTLTDGLSSVAQGYTLAAETTTFTANRTADLQVTVTGPSGPLTTYEPREDGAELRILVVRRDGAGFQALYPEPSGDGGWVTPLRLPSAGAWRAIAQFTPAGGTPTTLGTDLFVPGDFSPVETAPGRSAQADGYQVRLDGDLRAGIQSAVFATVSRDGAGITDLEPDRGTFGDVVALRAGDLAVVPVPAQTRAAPQDRSGPGIAFTALVPTEGVYHLYLRFRHAGAEHLVDFTVPTFGTQSGGAR
ncbi:hypothetical protein [Pseudonocardia pini]|uniref:hypothetical protein n=1 Tax=Pseudonocardia pini TaxID=2758030 RepID=UPI001FE7FC97|nr:hypothetical protein [Pseudonocardia pini]